jgi:hypothetical protein
VAAATETNPPAGRWTLQYFYDRKGETLAINDFRFVTAKFGIAVGWVGVKKGKPKPMSVTTHDGGAKWDLQALPDVGLSTFFLNDSLGWLVGEKELWRTQEGGRDWKKLKTPKDSDINRVFFRDESNGWAVCDHKKVLETEDGGRTWTELEAAAKPSANPDYTAYNWIEFLNANDGIIVGSSIPPRPGERPAWMDPEGAAKRREWPSLTLTLETRDGGKTWTAETAPAFGQTARYRPRPDGYGLVLIRFTNAFEWPAELYLVKPKGGSTRLFREKDRVVTDCAWLSPSEAMLVAIEPPGRLPQLPVPGKLHVLESSGNLTHWNEMKVDYRAFGTRAMLSVLNPDLAWVATDTGQILKLSK